MQLVKIYDKGDTGRDVSYVNPEEIAGITVFEPENKRAEDSTIVIPDEFKEKAAQIMLKSGKILTGEPRFINPLIKNCLIQTTNNPFPLNNIGSLSAKDS